MHPAQNPASSSSAPHFKSVANFNHMDTSAAPSPNLHMSKPLGPDSLLLQGFDYEAAKERYEAAKERRRARRAQAASNNNESSNSKSACNWNVNANVNSDAARGTTIGNINNPTSFDVMNTTMANNLVCYTDPKKDDDFQSLLRPINNDTGNSNESINGSNNGQWQSQSEPQASSASITNIDRESYRQEIDDFFAMRGQAWNVDSLDTFGDVSGSSSGKSAEPVDVHMTPKAWWDFVTPDESAGNPTWDLPTDPFAV